jgi:hypothetical protein
MESKSGENPVAEVNLWPVWRELGLSALQRSDHGQSCLLCKAMIDQCALTANEDYMREAAELLKKHAELPSGACLAAGPKCKFSDCLHHENVSHELGMAILKLHGDEKPWRDDRGVKVGLAPIFATKDDKPTGFEIGKDAAHRKDGNESIAAEVYVRLMRKKTTVHVWMTPTFPSRNEDPLEAVCIADLRRVYEERLAGYREWVMAKWDEMKGLAEMEISASQPAVEPKRKRTRKSKGKE